MHSTVKDTDGATLGLTLSKDLGEKTGRSNFFELGRVSECTWLLDWGFSRSSTSHRTTTPTTTKQLSEATHTHTHAHSPEKKTTNPANMSSVEESLFISQFLAAYGSQETKYPSTYVPSGLAPSWTSKVRESSRMEIYTSGLLQEQWERSKWGWRCYACRWWQVMSIVSRLDANKVE